MISGLVSGDHANDGTSFLNDILDLSCRRDIDTRSTKSVAEEFVDHRGLGTDGVLDEVALPGAPRIISQGDVVDQFLIDPRATEDITIAPFVHR